MKFLNIKQIMACTLVGVMLQWMLALEYEPYGVQGSAKLSGKQKQM